MKQLAQSLKHIRAAQEKWAHGRLLDAKRPDYIAKLYDNLFLGRLRPETELEFRKGDGSELSDTRSRPAKMRALISSSALAVNFFDAWRDTKIRSLAAALGLAGEVSALHFEFRPDGYPVKPRSPNLDLMLTLTNGERVAIESKLSEPYGSGVTSGLSEKYFSGSRRLWEAVNLPAAQQLADSLRPQWRHLDAPQLMKHMLGLASDPEGASKLLYLWYDTGLPDARDHRGEIDRFAEAVHGDRIEFVSETYQAVFKKLRSTPSPIAGWHTYLSERYFPRLDTVE